MLPQLAFHAMFSDYLSIAKMIAAGKWWGLEALIGWV